MSDFQNKRQILTTRCNWPTYKPDPLSNQWWCNHPLRSAADIGSASCWLGLQWSAPRTSAPRTGFRFRTSAELFPRSVWHPREGRTQSRPAWFARFLQSIYELKINKIRSTPWHEKLTKMNKTERSLAFMWVESLSKCLVYYWWAPPHPWEDWFLGMPLQAHIQRLPLFWCFDVRLIATFLCNMPLIFYLRSFLQTKWM